MKKISVMKLLIWSNCLIMIIFFSMDSFFSQRSYKRVLENEMETSQYQMLVYISDRLEQSMNAIELLARSAANNYGIINSVTTYKEKKNSYEQMVFQNNMNQNLSSFAYSLKDIVSVNILLDDPQLRTTKINGVYDYGSYMRDGAAEVIRDMSAGWISTRENNLVIKTYDTYIMTYVQRIYSGLYSGEGIGHLVINLNESLFYEQLKDYTDHHDSVILVLDVTGKIISSTDRSVLGLGITDTRYNQYCEIDGEQNNYRDIIYTEKDLNSRNLSIIAIADYDKVAAPIREVQSLVLVTSLALLVIFSLFCALLAYQISKPILKLSNEVMKAKENGFKTPVMVHSRIYEIDLLGSQFNSMTSQIGQLITSLLKQEKQKQKKELEILQAQINPHFLYNTLDAINWMALSMKQKEISNMVILLGNFLRLSLNKGKNIYTVRDELSHLSCYLDIQNIRCRGKILYTADVDDEVLGDRMVKLLLQPLVENSILHGFDFRGGVGQIWVKAYKEEEFLYFTVTDDGCGMSRELTDQVCDRKSEVGHGLKNVMKRISLYYGEGCGLTIRSTLQVGTTIEIKICSAVPNQQGED